jgi:hypothetical protein
MTDIRRAIDIPADPDRIFAFASDLHNLPRYVPTARSAEATGVGKIHVEGEIHGQHYADDGHMFVDAGRRLMSWGSGETGYRGELTVEQAGDGARVEISLHFHDDGEAPSVSEIGRSLDESLARLKSEIA